MDQTQAWFVSANNQLFGPYSQEQLRTFIAQDRVAAASLVRLGNSGAFETAASHAALAQYFGLQPTAPISAPTQGADNTPFNFVVIADLKSRGGVAFEGALKKLGPNYRVNPLVWLLQSNLTAGAVRNELTPYLGASDHLLIVDAGRNKIAWYNFGPQADAHFRSIWLKNTETRAN